VARLHGIKRNGDALVCMVVGCGKKAIYKNAQSARTGVVRGYCSTHKAMATSPISATDGRRIDEFIEYVYRDGGA
jgi:hypothetical protein